MVHGAHGDGGGGGGHVGEDPFAEGFGSGGNEHGADEGTAGGGEVVAEGGGHGVEFLLGKGHFGVPDGVQQDESEEAGGVEAGGLGDDDAAHGVADEDESVAADVAEDGLDVLAEGFHGVVGAGGAGVSVAGEVEGDDAAGLGQGGDLLAEVAGVAAPAMDEDEGGFAGAMDFVGDGGAVGGGDDAGAFGECREGQEKKADGGGVQAGGRTGTGGFHGWFSFVGGASEAAAGGGAS